MTLREAIALGLSKGWTAKETAFETGKDEHHLRNKAWELKVSFPYGGVGKKPKYCTKLKKGAKWLSYINNHGKTIQNP